ncbi:MAG: hypothetical protein P4M15_07295 [Alphaproteobacteria bacterium]|nr:hypothetical protein [Alphaproteobacteria bacterium]
MTADRFACWLDRLHLSNTEAAKVLGCGINTIARYKKPGAKIPRYIALACAALAHGVPPID